jgi:hypothetical protein
MDFEDVILVGSVRQTIRSPTLTVNGAGIGDCIQTLKSGKSWMPPVSNPPDVRAEVSPSEPLPMADDEWGSWGVKKKKGKKK